MSITLKEIKSYVSINYKGISQELREKKDKRG